MNALPTHNPNLKSIAKKQWYKHNSSIRLRLLLMICPKHVNENENGFRTNENPKLLYVFFQFYVLHPETETNKFISASKRANWQQKVGTEQYANKAYQVTK
jgi:hypothetical protein